MTSADWWKLLGPDGQWVLEGRKIDELIANFEHIERCVNAHDDLVHALRTFLVAVDDSGPEQFLGHHLAYLKQVAIPRAQEALAKVSSA
jgi:hypothetical protein